jgi:hypothetical protein
VIPSTSRNYGQVAVVSCDNNNLYSQRMTQKERDQVQREEVDLASLSNSKSSSTIDLGALSSLGSSTSTLGVSVDHLVFLSL